MTKWFMPLWIGAIVVFIAATFAVPIFLTHSALWGLWRDVWRVDRRAVIEGVGLFALMPLAFAVLVVVDWLRARRERKHPNP